MILVSDIGNSNITIGIFEDDELIMNARINTDKNYTIDQFAVTYYEILNINKIDIEKIEGSIISSVVPEITLSIKKAIEIVTNSISLIVGPGIKTGLNILIDDPAELGADFVIASVAIKKKYPLPCICYDLGTATKIFIVDKDGAFIGGAIAPGVKVSLNALSSNTSLLPYIGLDIPKKYRDAVEKADLGFKISDKDMKSGFVLNKDNLIYNGDFRSLVKSEREDLEKFLAEKLFS